jgi:hypothetical protein
MTMADAFSPVWPGPRLLVPMAMDVLLIGQIDVDSKTVWARTRNRYEALYSGVDGTPPPFTEKDCPPVGAHLLWTIPYRLRQGEQIPEGKPGAGGVLFPRVPDRWVVLRVYYPDQGDAQVTAAVLESDHISDFDETQPQYPWPADPAEPVKRIGRWVPLAEWDGGAGGPRAKLEAAGPGDVAWAAVYDNVAGVFGLHDPLPAAPGWLTYHVSGWYADPAADPLHDMPGGDEAAWRAAVQEGLRWSVGQGDADLRAAREAWDAWKTSRGVEGGGDAGLPRQLCEAMDRWRSWRAAHGVREPGPALPTQLLCHGTVATIRWDGPARTYGTGVPRGGQVADVAVGNTAAEAVSAYLARKVVDRFGGSEASVPAIERALEAFEKGLLYDLQDDVVGTEMRLHAARFGTAAGGTEWIVVRPTGAGDGDDRGIGDHPPEHGGQLTVPLDAVQTAALVALQRAQRAHDERARRLHNERWELFALANKQSRFEPARVPEDVQKRVDDAAAVMLGVVRQGIEELGTLHAAIGAAASALTALLGDAYVLKSVDLPPFAGPQDPVVMVGGAGHDRKLAPPDEKGEELLLVRFTGQRVTSLAVPDVPTSRGAVPAEIGAAELLERIALPAGNAIPKELPDLWIEAIFLDPGAAPLLARAAFARAGVPQPTDTEVATLAERIRQQQRAAWGRGASQWDVRHLAAGSWLRGVLPSPLAVELRAGQPWAPLFLDWMVSWHPTPSGMEPWRLDDVDYALEPPYRVGTQVMILSGRTVLNPSTTRSLQARFATFTDAPGGLPEQVRKALAHVKAMVGDLDVLTQSLGGFTDQLLTRATVMNLAPDDALVRDAVGDERVTFQPQAGDPNAPASAPAFHPVRGGHVRVMDLWVVDQFGQVMRGRDPQQSFVARPIRAESLRTPEATPTDTANRAFVQLPPRLSQPARLELSLLQADDDRVASNSADRTNPICGWVMPNHLDDSLIVFDAAGVNLGAVFAVERDVDHPGAPGTGLRWEAVPGSDAPLGAPPRIANPHLLRFVQGLLEQGLAGSGALGDLLDAIDSSLWRIDPFGEQEGNLAVLLGRPLAVVRAAVALSLHGSPVYDQAWGETGTWYMDNGRYVPRPPPYVSTPFRVRVGDLAHPTNGVLGYFQDDDYARFFAVYGAGAQTAALRRALQTGRLRQGQALRLLHAGAAADPGFGDGYVRRDHLVQVAPDGKRAMLTLLMEPRGVIPTVAGSLPAATATLAPGPVAEALRAMKTTFRVGPVLADPRRVRMPLPAQVRGKWGWMARKDVTSWRAEAPVEAGDDVARLDDTPRVLGEGWLTLSGAQAPREP